jgi:hypothetical protein
MPSGLSPTPGIPPCSWTGVPRPRVPVRDPSFLYSIALGGGRALVEETSLARRPTRSESAGRTPPSPAARSGRQTARQAGACPHPVGPATVPDPIAGTARPDRTGCAVRGRRRDGAPGDRPQLGHLAPAGARSSRAPSSIGRPKPRRLLGGRSGHPGRKPCIRCAANGLRALRSMPPAAPILRAVLRAARGAAARVHV